MRKRTEWICLFLYLGMGCVSEDPGMDDTESDAESDTDADDTSLPTIADADGDGVTVEEGDCNDADATIYPEAPEVLDDQIDQDCDGHDAVTCTGDYTYSEATNCGAITGNLLIATDTPTIDGLDSLTHIGGHLEVIGNSATSLSLDSLTHVGGSLHIHSNPSLTSFSITRLTEVGGELRVSFNDSLTSFSLDSLTDIGDALFIWYNAALCQSQVDAFIDALQARGWDGTSLYAEYNADC